MSPERGRRVYAAFEAALECDPAGRAARLEELCGDDAELRADVERLLARDAEAERDRFLATRASTEREAPRIDRSTDGESEFDWARSLEGTDAETSSTAATVPPDLAEHPDYEIKRRLGRGGMGLVYLAENRLTGRIEVLKVVGRQIGERPGALERFRREIRAVAKLHHPNIVAAYYAARLGDSVVLAMEYVDGLDLAEVVKARGPLPVATACDYVRQAALGLQDAHEHGMVHRDVKPSNLMLTRQGDRDVVKVLDFGLAKVQSEQPTDGTLTHVGQMLGTPDYIAPEQISDARRADIRADVYSLGATLYYLLTGGPPFPRTSLYDILQAHHSADATPLNTVRPDVPVELAALVAKMMAKDPEHRFRTLAKVADALTPFLEPVADPTSGSTPEASRVGPAAPSGPPPGARSAQVAQPATSGAASSSSAPTSRRRRVLAAAAGALLFALMVASVVIFKTRKGTIVFENLPERSVVAVDGDTFTVEWPDGKGKGRARITIPPGKHAVEVKVNGLKVSGEEVSVESGGVTSFIVRIDRPLGPAEPPASPTALPGSPPEQVKNSVGMTFVLIPAGDFVMGSRYEPPAEDERPPHPVTISRAFYLGAFEVTQQQYETIMGKNPSHFSGRPSNPVDDVTWIDAVTFCNRLSEREKLPPYYRIASVDDVTVLGGTGYRLPTEAEWEYACRAGNLDNVPFLTDAIGDKYAWMWRNSNGMTHPVGEKEPNDFGLHDMYGNVWEWCWDWVGPYSAISQIDPTGPATGTRRVLRGNGWWNGEYNSTRPSFRLAFSPRKTSPNHDFGFRIAAGGRDGLPVIAAESPAGEPGGKPPAPAPPTGPRERNGS
jgi:serine/threonine protein kinase